jgi:chromosomal replication initiation ATPase DnaA
MVRACVQGDAQAARFVVLFGPARSGKSVLLDWACRRGGDAVFRLDIERLRSGRSRGLVPRKPLVVADDLDRLERRSQGQRTLCTILDAVLDRGHRVLCAVEDHPANGRFEPALRSRLLGGLLVPVEAAAPAAAGGEAPAPQGDDATLVRLKDVAARVFDVERGLLDADTKRRSIVAVRRTVIAAACRGGLALPRVARHFGFRSERALREACRWVEREEARDRRFAALVHEVARVLPKP